MVHQNASNRSGGVSIAHISIGVFFGGVAVLVVYRLLFVAPQPDLLAQLAGTAKSIQESKIIIARNDVQGFKMSCEMYLLQKRGKCPGSMQDLKSAGIIDRAHPDPWGSAYIVKCPGTHGEVEVTSNGPDKRPDTGDDINSWDASQQ